MDYSAMAVAALVAIPAQLGGSTDAKSKEGPPRDLFALTGGIVAVMTGALMVVLPDQYRAPAYDKFRPNLTLLCVALFVAGGAVGVGASLPSVTSMDHQHCRQRSGADCLPGAETRAAERSRRRSGAG
jgi:hypothetical protein